MKEYLNFTFDEKDPELISVIDDLPLWSAPFGLRLLEIIELKKHINVLDIGCGLGFPLIELSQRLGTTCNIYGIDPWAEAIERAKLKKKVYNIENVKLFNVVAEKMPFDNEFFDLIVSNNGINNVQDLSATFSETYRVSKRGAQFVFSMNTKDTMIEFYTVFEKVLRKYKLMDEIEKMNEQIYSKRKPQSEIESYLLNSGFSINNIISDSFELRFVDVAAMFNHYLIKYWFLEGWKSILNDRDMERIFKEVEINLNLRAVKNGYCKLTIPFLVFDCRVKNNRN